MSNYRPLSLLKNDYKLFAKILAMWLESVVPLLVHFEQVGFVKGRSAANNIRRLFHVMNKAALSQHPAVMLSLDAEKAFDRIEWLYLFCSLEKYGLGPVCMQWIHALYYKPLAHVKTVLCLNPLSYLGRIDKDVQSSGSLLWLEQKILHESKKETSLFLVLHRCKNKYQRFHY